MTDLVSARDPFTGGQWAPGAGQPLAVRSPATDEVVATVSTSSPVRSKQRSPPRAGRSTPAPGRG